MPSKVYAISKPSAEIALRYGTNVSRGIQKMESIITAQRVAIDVLEAAIKKKREGVP